VWGARAGLRNSEKLGDGEIQPKWARSTPATILGKRGQNTRVIENKKKLTRQRVKTPARVKGRKHHKPGKGDAYAVKLPKRMKSASPTPIPESKKDGRNARNLAFVQDWETGTRKKSSNRRRGRVRESKRTLLGRIITLSGGGGPMTSFEEPQAKRH